MSKMNERIRELADRACEYADYDPGYIPDEFLLKFAELVYRTMNEILEAYQVFSLRSKLQALGSSEFLRFAYNDVFVIH